MAGSRGGPEARPRATGSRQAPAGSRAAQPFPLGALARLPTGRPVSLPYTAGAESPNVPWQGTEQSAGLERLRDSHSSGVGHRRLRLGGFPPTGHTLPRQLVLAHFLFLCNMWA